MKVVNFLNRTNNFGLVFLNGDDRLSVHCEAGDARNETDGRSVSGFAAMYVGVVVPATCCTKHCVTLSTTEPEYVAVADGAKEGLFSGEFRLL